MSDNILTFRQVGQDFIFLGIKMVVMSHSEDKTPTEEEYEVGCRYIAPYITVLYADKHGILQEHNFYNCDLPALICQCGRGF